MIGKVGLAVVGQVNLPRSKEGFDDMDAPAGCFAERLSGIETVADRQRVMPGYGSPVLEAQSALTMYGTKWGKNQGRVLRAGVVGSGG